MDSDKIKKIESFMKEMDVDKVGKRIYKENRSAISARSCQLCEGTGVREGRGRIRERVS